MRKLLLAGGFRVTGRISTLCCLSDPLSGELSVETAAVPIHSIDIHLLRIESIIFGERIITETSLVQTTQACYNFQKSHINCLPQMSLADTFPIACQIADGDICRNMTLPIYVILPRLLTCPTSLAG